MNHKEIYADYIKEFNLTSKTRGIWEFIGETPSIEYGWKLHVSSVQWEVFSLLKKILPTLLEFNVPFKIAHNSDVLAMLNEGSFGSTQIGKFMTIYPQSDEECVRIAKTLVRETKKFNGPKIITDLHLGGTVYTRFGTFNPKITRDRLGNINIVGSNPDAGYKVPFVIPEKIDNPFKEFKLPKGGILTKFEGRLIGPGYLIAKTINVHAKGSIYKALDMRDQKNIGFVILKEARKFCVSDVYGRHMFDRLSHQEQIHKKLKGKIPMPDVIEKFEFADNLYLCLSFIDGIDLEQRLPAPFYTLSPDDKLSRLQEFKKLSEIIKILHAEGVIHRDLSPRNIRIDTSGSIFILDFELSYDVTALNFNPFTEGTAGYISPQQKEGEHPTTADDIYSLGSLFLMQITGFDSQRTLYGYLEPDLFAEKIAALSGTPQSLCEIIIECLNKKKNLRPSIDQIIAVISTCIKEAEFKRTTTKYPLICLSNEQRLQLINKSLNWFHNEISQEETSKLWFSPEIESHNVASNVSPNFKLYRSVSRGVSGVVYSISRLHKMGYVHKDTSTKINSAIDWLLNHEPTPDDQMPGLHFGEAGVAVAIAEAVSAGITPHGDWLIPYMNEALSGPLDWPDITHGAAGQGLAAILCARLLNNNDLLKHTHRCFDYLIQNQLEDGSWKLPGGVNGMEGSTYTGFAHGVAGIIYYLSKYSLIFNEKTAKTASIKGAKWLLEQKQTIHKSAINWPMLKDQNESWKWWCHGGPGISLALLALFELTGNNEYLEVVKKSLNIHGYAICYNNLSQCHGLSGLGEIYLDAFKTTKVKEFYSRAKYIASKLESLARVDSNGASWLVENTFKPTADLMIGCAGITHFLSRFYNVNEYDWGSPLMAH